MNADERGAIAAARWGRVGVTADPNREDDAQYIARLVGQVVRLSIEAVKIVKSLPSEFA